MFNLCTVFNTVGLCFLLLYTLTYNSEPNTQSLAPPRTPNVRQKSAIYKGDDEEQPRPFL